MNLCRNIQSYRVLVLAENQPGVKILGSYLFEGTVYVCLLSKFSEHNSKALSAEVKKWLSQEANTALFRNIKVKFTHVMLNGVQFHFSL